jgi:hypothetical protein
VDEVRCAVCNGEIPETVQELARKIARSKNMPLDRVGVVCMECTEKHSLELSEMAHETEQFHFGAPSQRPEICQN